jgi:hypothetical protein
LKIVFSALFAIVSFAALFSVSACKKTYNTVVQDSIYYSSWTPLAMSFNTSDSLYYQDFNNSKITAKVIDHGAVLGYFGAVSSGDTTISSASEWPTYLGVLQQLQVGVLDLSSYYNLSYPNGDVPFLYRYVIIPGNVLANSSLKDLSKDQLNKMKFTDIQKALNNAQSSSGGNRPIVSGN